MGQGVRVRVLGVDPGLTRCGFGVVDVDGRRKTSMVFVDVIGTRSDIALDQRLLAVLEKVEKVLSDYSPDVLAVERVFSALNVATVMGTAQASGVVIGAAAKRGIPVAMHTPTEVKAAVTGDGQAGKPAVTKMITKILGLETAPHPADAADALALAVTHAWRGGATEAPASRVGAAARTVSQRMASPKTAAQLKWEEALKTRR